MKTHRLVVRSIFLMVWLSGLLGAYSSIYAEDISDQELFRQLDQNRDGVLIKSEMSETQLVYFERLLRKSDGNNDGKLTVVEMTEGLKEPEASANLDVAGGPGGRGPGGSPEQMFQFMDRNQDGKLQRGELPEMAKERLGKVFDFLNKDEVSKEEYLQIMQRMMGPGMAPNGKPGTAELMPKPGPEQLMMMMQKLDQNGDGKISPNEVPERAKPVFSQVQRRMGLKETDTVLIKEIKDKMPGSGEYGVEIKPEMENSEMKKSDRSKENVLGKEPASFKSKEQDGALFKQMDKNDDGSISREEAPDRMKQFFERIDQNKDGKLSIDELGRAREQREKK